MAQKPIKLGWSPLSGKVYAFRHWKHDGPAVVAIGKREDRKSVV